MITTIENKTNTKIETLVKRGKEAAFTDEYNCKLNRLFPWSGVANTKRQISEFGIVWVVVEPQTTVDAHEHDEEESFIVISGKADLEIAGEFTTIGKGDVIYIPRFDRHQIINNYQEDFVFIDIYWDDQSN